MKTHGESQYGTNTSEWRAWSSMLSRCNNPKHPAYKNYGGRGITVYSKWMGRDGYSNFLSDLGRKPSRDHQLDRIDNDAGYFPQNCRWATRKEQARNRRSNKVLSLNGKSQTIAAWEEEMGLQRGVIRDRISSGWNIEEAITTPQRRVRQPFGIGTTVNSWTIQSSFKKDGEIFYQCVCKCGRNSIVRHYDLEKQKSTRCRKCRAEDEKGSALG